ncbi:phage tail protein [uncultured Bartonella sp.]|uniref:phage tail protein n=1 Tax=uncultured Bartonella sp. TaxID=104108 RepID=UPI0026205008|nr:phage tail protein [uncultured Bartonella sp.]
MSSIYDWSFSAASNANADNIINWTEGQPPSTVNNSARSMMQRVREYIADLGGDVIVDGQPSSIRITAKAPVTAYVNGITIRFRALYSNGGASTLCVNNMEYKPLFKASYNGVTPLAAGDIQAGGIYETVYHQALNNGSGGWFLSAPTPPQSIPSGTIAMFAAPTAPSGWIQCDGRWLSRAQYPALFAAIGEWWGKGDGQTTFNVPDLRGQFLRGWDAGKGVDANRSFASWQDSQNKWHSHSGSTSENGEHNHTYGKWISQGSGPDGKNSWNWFAEINGYTSTAGRHSHNFTTNGDGGNEARPVNLAIQYIIKA